MPSSRKRSSPRPHISTENVVAASAVNQNVGSNSGHYNLLALTLLEVTQERFLGYFQERQSKEVIMATVGPDVLVHCARRDHVLGADVGPRARSLAAARHRRRGLPHARRHQWSPRGPPLGPLP